MKKINVFFKFPLLIIRFNNSFIRLSTESDKVYTPNEIRLRKTITTINQINN
jgi:hypothetical protein